MSQKRFPLIVGNWKMNGLKGALHEVQKLDNALTENKNQSLPVVLCLPATLIALAAQYSLHSVSLGGQDCHMCDSGAYTGDISAVQLQDVGAQWVILGHSERRLGHCEKSAQISEKTQAAWRAGLHVIICVGESLEQYEAQQTLEIVTSQLQHSIPQQAKIDRLVVAYEPVWAIGSGLIPSEKDIMAVHAHLRHQLCLQFGEDGQNIPLLYGGSVKAQNAKEILAIANVDGVLVGGASLKADEFFAISQAAQGMQR